VALLKLLGAIWRWLDEKNRPLTLALVVVMTAMMAYLADRALTGGALYQRFLFPPAQRPDSAGPEWKDLFQALLVVLGLPMALLLWHWRDRNVHHQIENQRKDTNLREFQELQLRAAGSTAGSLADRASETIQIAALHQLRGYLRGDYGESFVRPTFELLCVLLSADKGSQSEAAAAASTNPTVTQGIFTCVRDIVFEEHKAFFRREFPFSGRKLKSLRIANGADLSDFTFERVDFSGSHFSSSIISSAVFEKCDLRDARFRDVSIINSRFNHCKIENVEFDLCPIRNSNISLTSLVKTNFFDCSIFGTNFSHILMDRVDFRGTRFFSASFFNLRGKDVSLKGCEWDDFSQLWPITMVGNQVRIVRPLKFQWSAVTAEQREAINAYWLFLARQMPLARPQIQAHLRLERLDPELWKARIHYRDQSRTGKLASGDQGDAPEKKIKQSRRVQKA
jgi:hypothetical protein